MSGSNPYSDQDIIRFLATNDTVTFHRRQAIEKVRIEADLGMKEVRKFTMGVTAVGYPGKSKITAESSATSNDPASSLRLAICEVMARLEFAQDAPPAPST